MAVLQHAPAGYLLSVPLTELQITIKESCLSFLRASRKTYSGFFTLIFIHLVIDKCGAVRRSLPPPGLSLGTFAPAPSCPHPAHGSRRVFRRPGPRKDTRGRGVIPLSPPCAGCGKSFALFYFCSSPQALSPRRQGQPRQHRHAGRPGGFSHSCGRRRHGNELLAGEWRPPPARSGPARPAGTGAAGLALLLEAFGGSRAVPSLAAQSPGAGTVNPWHAAGPRLPVGRALATPAPSAAPPLLPHSHGQHSVGSVLPPPGDVSGEK